MEVIAHSAWVRKVAAEVGRQLDAWPARTSFSVSASANRKKWHCAADWCSNSSVSTTSGGCQMRSLHFPAEEKWCWAPESFPKPIVEAIRNSRTNGHIIRAAGAEDRLFTFWCTKCGAHARTVPKGLSEPGTVSLLRLVTGHSNWLGRGGTPWMVHTSSSLMRCLCKLLGSSL